MTANVATIPSGLAPAETFEHWRAATASIFTVEPPSRDAVDHFEGRLASCNLQRFLIGSSLASPMNTRRDRDLVGRLGVDHLLFQLYVSGSGEYEAEGRTGTIRPGDLVCFDLGRRHSARLTELETISVVLPRSLVELPCRTLDGAHGLIVPGSSGLATMMTRQLRAINDSAPHLEEHEFAAASTLMAAIVGVALSQGTGRQEADHHAHAALTVQTIRAFIDDNVTDPSLSPETIARHLRVSRSALYRIFEPLGGISNYIRDRRLDRAALHLSAVGTGRGATSRLAACAGFSSEATFQRVFRARYGVSPREAIGEAASHLSPIPGGAGPDARNWLHAWLASLAASPEPYRNA